MRKWRTSIACGLLVAIFVGLSYSAVRTKSPTTDEPMHTLAAWVWTHQADYRLDPEDPPLWGYFLSIPNVKSAIRADFTLPTWQRIPQTYWTQSPWWRETLFQTPGNDVEAIVARSRIMAVIIGAALCALTASLAYRLAGAPAAIVAACLFAVDPNFLAHASLVKNDVAISLIYLATAYTVWKFGRRPSIVGALMIGVLCGIGMSVKFSGVLLGPIVFALLAIRAISLRRDWLRMLGTCALIAVISISVLWASYRFRYSATADDSGPMNIRLQVGWAMRARLVLEYPDHPPTASELANASPGPMLNLAMWVNDHHFMPEAWLNGLLYTYHTSLVRPAFLLGEVRQSGWWYYFPLAVLFKTPLATLSALVLAGSFGAYYFRRERMWDAICLLLPPAVYFLIAMSSNLNLGLRHVFPIYPPMFIAAGVVAAKVWRDQKRLAITLGIVLASALAAESLAAWPNYIPFFNVAAGDYRGGFKLLGDSNLDWGQDLPLLAKWQREHPDTPLYLHYFGNADPVRYVRAQPLNIAMNGWPKAHAVMAISATHLQGIYLPSPNLYERLRRQQPLAILGGSIYLFEAPANPDKAR